MSEAVTKIVRLERRVMWRNRLLSLQDELAVAVIIGGLIAAALVVLVRFRPIGLPLAVVILAAMVLSIAIALVRAFFTRASASDSAFLIDKSLELDDRLVTSQLIIDRGGPKSPIEEALIEDAANRVGNRQARSILPFRMRRWYSLALVSLAGIVTALLIPASSLPAAEAVLAERADIQSAGEHLEQTATEVEQSVPPGTETASLAKEQVDLGRGFRRSPATRTEALKRLSALEERILRRHDDLASTRADEIVSLADQRLGRAPLPLSTAAHKTTEQSEDKADGLAEGPDKNVNTPDNSVTMGTRQKEKDRQKHSPEPVSRKGKKVRGADMPDSTRMVPERTNPPDGETVASPSQDQSQGKPAEREGVAEGRTDQGTAERKTNDQQPSGEQPTDTLDALRKVPNSLTAQAARALPKMSEELIKKAAALRANELSPADIESLRKAAESLSHDLSQIGQAKELQRALEEMARHVGPEQIEQVARELGNQEKIKKELEASARLLSENRQAKEMVAGLLDQLARNGDKKRPREGSQADDSKSDLREESNRAGGQISRGTRANGSVAPETLTADRRLAGQGRASSLKGKLQQTPGGEYLYLQSKAAAGAARAPYSSAYPQYRREAERSVERTRVPPALRSVVRKYFDAINPDAKR